MMAHFLRFARPQARIRSCIVRRPRQHERLLANDVARRTAITASGPPEPPRQQQQQQEQVEAQTDVLIVGGGVVGCAMAQQLTQRAPSLKVGLVEARSGPSTPSSSVDTVTTESDEPTPPNPRSYALSPFSLQLLGLDRDDVSSSSSSTSASPSSRLGYYDSMQIWESGQPASLIFHAQDIQAQRLGAVVEDSTIVQHLWGELVQDQRNCRIWENTIVQGIALPRDDNLHHPAQVTVVTKDASHANATTTTKIQTNLVIGADGANSAVRRMLGIGRTQFEYGQSALTFTVELETDHGGRAFQRFTAHGTLALLPTFSPKHAIVVWSTAAEDAVHWKNHPDLVPHVNQLLQDGPSRLEPFFGTLLSGFNLPTSLANLAYGVDKVIETAQYGPAMTGQEWSGRPFVPTPTMLQTVSPHFSFPLQTGQVQRYTDPRLALVGDAAHTVSSRYHSLPRHLCTLGEPLRSSPFLGYSISRQKMHPMAGQGLNLGLQDVANLADLIVRAADAGMDMSTFLEDYERSRKLQVSLTLGGMHALHHMFGVQHPAAKHIKSLGMNAIQNLPPLRRALVDVACQGVAR